MLNGQRKKYGFDFMKTFLKDMCQDDSTKRLTMTEVASLFEEIMTKFALVETSLTGDGEVALI